MKKPRTSTLLGSLFGLILFSVAIWSLSKQLKDYPFEAILNSLQEISTRDIYFSIAFCALNYVILIGYDAMGLHYLRHRLPASHVAVASFISYALSHNMGATLLSGSVVRYRMYYKWELSAGEIAKLVAFSSFTYWLGFLVMGGIVFSLDPFDLPETANLPSFVSMPTLGALCLLLVAAYLLLIFLKKQPFQIWKLKLIIPSRPISLIQIAVTCADWLTAAAVLYFLLPKHMTLPLSTFLGVFLLAQTAGFISQVPGGLGVFESLFIYFLSPFIPASHVLGGLIAFRAIYYLLPMLVAIVMLAFHEFMSRKKHPIKLPGREAKPLDPSIK